MLQPITGQLIPTDHNSPVAHCGIVFKRAVANLSFQNVARFVSVEPKSHSTRTTGYCSLRGFSIRMNWLSDLTRLSAAARRRARLSGRARIVTVLIWRSRFFDPRRSSGPKTTHRRGLGAAQRRSRAGPALHRRSRPLPAWIMCVIICIMWLGRA